MGILDIIEQFEQEFYPISEAKKGLLAKQPIDVVLKTLSEMASWQACKGKIVW